MRRITFISLLALLSMIIVALSPALKMSEAQAYAAIYFDAFDGPSVFDDFEGQLSSHWATYRGTPSIVSAGGRSTVLRMVHPQTGGTLGTFGDAKSTSLYLTNPTTTTYADGMLEFDIYFEGNSEDGASANILFRMQSDDTYYALRLTSTRDWTSCFAKYLGCCNWQIIGTESSLGVFAPRTWSHVVVTLGGPRFDCYKDGVLICQAEDLAWQRGTFGGIGILNNYYNGVFYIDNFNIPGRFDWVIYRGSPRPDSTYGRIAPGWFFDHPAEAGDEAPFADGSAYSAYVTSPAMRCFRNGVIEFDILFQHDAGEKAFLVFRMQGESTHYGLRLTSTRDWTCYFAKFKGFGNREIIGTESSQGVFPVGIWSHVKVVIDGTRFECYRDGFLISSADDPEWSIGIFGGIGFYSAYNKGLFYVDNLKICFL